MSATSRDRNRTSRVAAIPIAGRSPTKQFGGDPHPTHHHVGSRRTVGSIVLIGVAVTVISICTAGKAEAEEPRRIVEAQEVRAEIQRPQAPLLLSVEVIPDAAASSARATLQNGDGAVAPIVVDPETTKPHNAP